MPDHYLETNAELSGDLSPKKKKKKHWWTILIDVVLLCLLVSVAGVSANVIYLTANYGDAFFVDGVSMYPTLNSNALKKGSDGNYSKVTWRSGEQVAGDLVDYGWARMGEKGINDLKRFDVVITYYEKDLIDQSDGTYKVSEKGSLKIKRLIAFPGETVQIKPDKGADGKLTTPWGTLLITGTDGTTRMYPSYYHFSDYEDIDGKSYRDYVLEKNQTYGPVTLDEDSYFVMGDNRADHYSDDSRDAKNKVTKRCLQGKAYLVTSLRELKSGDNGTLSPAFRLDKIKPFWNYQHLDGSVIEKTGIEVKDDA
jgi:signal peptidase I